MEQLERIQNRLDNIRGVEPILGALRTISMGSRQSVLKQKGHSNSYMQRLMSILSYLKSLIDQKSIDLRQGGSRSDEQERVHLALVIGTERGLCGRFNHAISAKALEFFQENSEAGKKVEFWILGSRLLRKISKQNLPITRTDRISITAKPSFHLAVEYARIWLDRFEDGEIEKASVIYNTSGSMGTYTPSILQVIPYTIPVGNDQSLQEAWPPPIIETDPLGLFSHILMQIVNIQIYNCLLESAAAEHSTRFHILEDATQNAQNLIEELNREVLAARRQSITREMQTLAAGAGLVGRS